MSDISVIIPIYNAENTISRAIDSVLSQINIDFEIVLINDGSTDNSEKIILDNFNDERIQYLYQKNGGVSSARNKGIEISSGKNLVFLDSDDYYANNTTLSTYYKNANRDTIYVCLTTMDSTSSNSFFDESNSEVLEFLFEKNLFNSPCNKCYSREIIINNNIRFNETVSLGEDLIFNAEYFKYTSNVLFDSEVQYVYDHQSNSNSLSKSHYSNSLEMFKHVRSALESLYNYKNYYKSNVFYSKLFVELLNIVLIPQIIRSGMRETELLEYINMVIKNKKVCDVIKEASFNINIPFFSILLLLMKKKYIRTFIKLVKNRLDK